MANTKIDQRIPGYKLQTELAEGERLQDLVLDSPDGRLYYQREAKDEIYDPAKIADLWQTADKRITVRISRLDGTVDAITETDPN